MNKLLSILTVSAACGCVMADGELPKEVLRYVNDPKTMLLTCNHLDQDSMRRLMELLKTNTHIKGLWLFGDKNKMDGTSVGYLAELMKTNKIIEEIMLYGYEMSWSGLVELGRILERNDSPLKRFILEYNIMCADDTALPKLEEFLESLKKNTTLKELELVCNGIIGQSTDGEDLIMKALKEWLTGNASLERLVLINEGLSTNGVKILGEALNSNQTLKELILTRNQNIKVIETLASSVDNNSSLEKLNLSNNSIQKEDLEHLGNLLKSFKNLKELVLEGNKIDDDGVKILCEIIRNVPNDLTCIDLTDNPISQYGIEQLRELEREKPELEIRIARRRKL